VHVKLARAEMPARIERKAAAHLEHDAFIGELCERGTHDTHRLADTVGKRVGIDRDAALLQ
jgi:hypothetical protein